MAERAGVDKQFLNLRKILRYVIKNTVLFIFLWAIGLGRSHIQGFCQGNDMEIKIWGSRGSMPVSGSEFRRYGGETTCLEVRLSSGRSIILDAGTGISAYDRANKMRSKNPVICLTHPHLDHIQGLPFFSGIYDHKNPLVIYGPEFSGVSLENSLARLFDGVLMPVTWSSLPRHDLRPVKPGESISIGDALLETCPTIHPGGCLAWKITADGWTFAYTGDHEIPLDNLDKEKNTANEKLMNFLTGCDIVLADSHFSDADHAAHPGWGHSSYNQWQHALKDRKTGRLFFTHFSPGYDDQTIGNLAGEAVNGPTPCAAVFDRCLISRDGIVETSWQTNCPACNFSQRVAAFSDTHAILEALLSAARKLGNADAGTAYLVDKGDLRFAAAQNDTLFPASAANKFAYVNSRLPIDRKSIAGYVAETGNILNIADVYRLPPDSEYKFNSSLDKASGYRTTSVLAIPLANGSGKLIGVLQLINSRAKNSFVPFSREMIQDIGNLCVMATIPLERSFLVVDMILRMLQTSALRDPSETSGHVRRVGSMAAELYHHWAEKAGMDPEKLLAVKGQLRLAAMLHDVGKVGIPDAILKKPGRLDSDERAIMEEHAYLGAGLFAHSMHEIDKMARDIALHHHARWDGQGYTGNGGIVSPKGEDIPIWARITAIADVYDALVSSRSYKKGWDADKALKILQEEAGSHFDPSLVQDFFEIRDLVQAISKRYADKPE